MTEEDREFQKVITEGLVPKIEGSSYCLSVVPGTDRIDAKFCVELGVMIMLDKPILAIVSDNEPVPKKLRLVADTIVAADITTDEGREIIRLAIEEFTKRWGDRLDDEACGNGPEDVA